MQGIRGIALGGYTVCSYELCDQISGARPTASYHGDWYLPNEGGCWAAAATMATIMVRDHRKGIKNIDELRGQRSP